MKNLITNIRENGIVWTAINYCYDVPIEKIYKSLEPRWYTIEQNGNLLERIGKKIWVAAQINAKRRTRAQYKKRRQGK